MHLFVIAFMAMSSVVSAGSAPTLAEVEAQVPTPGCYAAASAAQAQEPRTVPPADTQDMQPAGSARLWTKVGHGHWCRGWGICFIKGKRPRYDSDEFAEVRVFRAGDDLVLELPAESRVGEENVFVIDRDLRLPREQAAQLGARGDMSIARGRYISEAPRDGTIRVTVRVRGRWRA